jgi:very-short-patch-repair endonuclease
VDHQLARCAEPLDAPFMREIPPHLKGAVFTVAEARDAGITKAMLQGGRFVRLQRGLYTPAQESIDITIRIEAALRVLPGNSAVSHLTNLRLRGFAIGPELPLHFSTNAAGPARRTNVVLHRRQGLLHLSEVRGFPALGAMRTFVDAATMLNDRNLLRVGDWLASTGQVDVRALRSNVEDSHLDGVQRARRVAKWVRSRVASPRESDVRWALRRAGLPEPELNVDIHDDHGTWLAKGDLVYGRWKVLVEYDGWLHERDARQRQWDHLRREQLEANGWRLIVVTTVDMAKPALVAHRVRQALRQRGFDG